MTEQFSFNLIDEKWIPCIRGQDGRLITLTLRETLAQADELDDIVSDTPLQTSALYRLLIAILLRVYQPTIADFDTWEKMWRDPAWDMALINPYLDEWHHRFDLFDEKRPFYQSDSDDSRVRPKPLTSIKYGNGFLHNPLFDHDNDEDGLALTPAEAARNLLAVQAFGLGGGHKGMFSDAPWSKGILFFVQGNTLKETLFLNLLPYPDEDRGGIGIADTEDDAPAWEQDDPFAPKDGTPLGYLDYLTWQNRRILFFPEWQNEQLLVKQWQVGGGLSLTADISDPFKCYREHKKHGRIVYQFNESRGLWPNSYALFAPMNVGTDQTSVPPAAFIHLRELMDKQLLKADAVYRCKAMGQGKDRAKVEYLREERFPFPLRYLIDEALRDQLRDALQQADSIAFYLRGSLRRVGFYLYLVKPDEIGWKGAGINPKVSKFISKLSSADIDNWVRHTEADIYFWSALDVPFQEFIARLAEDNANEAMAWWKTEIRSAANHAFKKAKQYAHESDRAFRAIVEGQTYLTRQLDEKLGKEEKK